MTFSHPALLALAPIIVLVVGLALAAQWRRYRRLEEAFGGRKAASRLTSIDLHRFPKSRLSCLIAVSLALTIAAAGPHIDFGSTLDPEQPVDLVVAVDVSLSMTGDDVTPSRLDRAKEVVNAITESLTEERIGLAIFADWPYTVLPMTDDPELVRFFTASLAPDLIEERDQGTSLSLVIKHSIEMLDARHRPEAQQAILLITDGEGHEDPALILDSVAVATDMGIRVWTAGVGTSAGSSLMTEGDDPVLVLGDDGEPIVSRLNEDLLRSIATAGGGSYHDVRGAAGLRNLQARFRRAETASALGGEPVGLALWILLLAVPLLFLEGKMDAGGVIESPRLNEPRT